MKKLLLSVSVALLATGAFAQTKMSGTDARFGIKAGVNLANIRYSGSDLSALNDYTKNNVGFNITAFGDFGVANNFFIQPGISLQNKGTKVEIPGSVDDDFFTTGTITQNVMVIEVPINAVLRIPTGDAGAVQISAGPYIGFNISGKIKIGSEKEDIKFGSDAEDEMSSTDFGANFGLGYRLNNGIQFGANYGLGFANLVPKNARENGSKAANRVIGFSVGFSF